MCEARAAGSPRSGTTLVLEGGMERRSAAVQREPMMFRRDAQRHAGLVGAQTLSVTEQHDHPLSGRQDVEGPVDQIDDLMRPWSGEESRSTCSAPVHTNANFDRNARLYGSQLPPSSSAEQVAAEAVELTQEPEQVGDLLVAGLREARFLISAAPRVRDQLRMQADALLDPSALTSLYRQP